MSVRRLFIFGAGGHGKVVADAARASGWEVVGFVDDASDRDGTRFVASPVLAWEHLVAEPERTRGAAFALAVGGNAARQGCHERLGAGGFEVVTIVHPRAIISPGARLGPGTVVMAGAVVNPDAVVGPGAILNTGSIVEHDCRVGAYAHLSPNVALGGGVTIGDRAHLGLGAVVLPEVVVGHDVNVGAGAVVHRDVRDGLTVVGVPARALTGRV